VVVPNVFDFTGEEWGKDDYNRDLREEIGLGENDIVLLQATRIVARKGIELAIDFAKALQSPARRKTISEKGRYDSKPFSDQDRIVLLLAGYARDDVTGKYKDALIKKAAAEGVEMLLIENRVDARRRENAGSKIYSLWDTYTAADLVTYPSLWEGWGNQFLEAVKARLPLMIFEYPVYQSDIKQKDFKTISLGSEIGEYDQHQLVRVDQQIIENAADQAVDLLTDPGLRKQVVDHNYQVGIDHYSLEALAGYLEPLFKDI
jgi:glycosyltransferase involved in cell wall biosynthesis